MLWKRVATAAVLLPLLVVTILFGRGWPFALLALAAALLCAVEYFRMFLPSSRDRRAGVAMTGLAYASGALLPYPAAVSAILLCVGTTVILASGRGRYAFVTLVPLAVLSVTTLSAG